MITIEYTTNSVEGEPGPNVLWLGEPRDFLNIVLDLYPLGVDNGVSLSLGDFEYINLINLTAVNVRSTIGGSDLVLLDQGQFTINLDRRLWQQVLAFMLSISFTSSFNYVEFDNLDLTEQANLIIKSY